jgi:hypothetical protein
MAHGHTGLAAALVMTGASGGVWRPHRRVDSKTAVWREVVLTGDRVDTERATATRASPKSSTATTLRLGGPAVTG